MPHQCEQLPCRVCFCAPASSPKAPGCSSLLKAGDMTVPPLKLLPTHTTQEPGLHTAAVERIRGGKMEEIGVADSVVHKKNYFFSICVCMIQDTFSCNSEQRH